VSVRALLDPRRWRRQVGVAAVALALTLLVAVVASPGSGGLTASEALAALLGGGEELAGTVVWQVRVPRVLLGALVGASLALAGQLLQSLLRNPLADPFVLGVSSGAAFASVCGLSLGFALGGGGHPLAAAAGALGAAVMAWRLARDRGGRLGPHRLVLAGVVLSYLFSAGIMWVVSLSSAVEGQRYIFWLMGSLASASAADVAVLAVAFVPAAVAAIAVLPALNLLSFSEEHAADSGVSVEPVKRAVFVLAAVLTGASVAVAGSIGFVGLVVPHCVRLIFGSDNRLLAPLSALGGAGFLVMADLACRGLGELPVGVVTATCGAPFFLWLLVAKRES
jgi:iron complex transport system permease protein